jgi:hypothetical protein
MKVRKDSFYRFGPKTDGKSKQLDLRTQDIQMPTPASLGRNV